MLQNKMVPDKGSPSNPDSPLLKEWKANSKGVDPGLESYLGSIESDQLFDTLAEWNHYLENDVPFFKTSRESEEREP